MKNLLIASALLASLALGAGCSGHKQINATNVPIVNETPQTKEEQAAQAERARQLTAIAQASSGTWEGLTAEQRQAFLDFQKGNEELAKKYYSELVLLLRDESGG